MRAVLLKQWSQIPTDNKLYLVVGLILTIVFLVLVIRQKIREDRVKQFLITNGYTTIDFKTGKIKFPKVKITSDEVVIKNCDNKSKSEVEADRGKWEKFLNKKVLDIWDENNRTHIKLVSG